MFAAGGLAAGGLAAAAAVHHGKRSVPRLTFRRAVLAHLATAGAGANPYGIATVPFSSGKLVSGDVLVAEFNAAGGPAGSGTSILQVDPSTGATTVFAEGLPISGPVGLALNPVNDLVWVGDFGATNGSTANVAVLLPDGAVKAQYPAQTSPVTSGQQPSFAGVWGQGVSQLPSGQVSFYFGTTGSGATGAGGGSVYRIDPHPTGPADGQPLNATYVQLATGLGDNATATALPVTASNAGGPQGFAYDPATGTLYVADDANNTITAIPNAATATGPTATTTVPVAAGVLDLPENIALAPNGNLVVANAGNNTIAVIDPSTGVTVGVAVVDHHAAGALFGLAVAPNAHGTTTTATTVLYVDDNFNTLDQLVIEAHPKE